MNRRILIVTVTLISSFGLRLWSNNTKLVLDRDRLANFPRQAGAWAMTREGTLDEESEIVLKADDYLMRRYRKRDGQQVDVFIAYYNTQKAGESMHSPKNCL